MRVLITGSRGFIGKNLAIRLVERGGIEVLEFTRGDSLDSLFDWVSTADAIIHLAGENRPQHPEEFFLANVGLTAALCNAVRESGRKIPLIFSSSTQAAIDNPYGRSKREAERLVERLSMETGSPAVIYRLPGVFGKWCKPNYNSVVATFCHNIANDQPIQIHDRSHFISLAYVDDVIERFMGSLNCNAETIEWGQVAPVYSVALGDLANQIYAFKECRSSLMAERVGVGLTRALYATYLSYLPTEKFSYELPRYADDRGMFVEMLKTPDAGQFSYFTAHPGVTRGGHYHHTKTEKFLVLKGSARFRFRHIVTRETYQLLTSGGKPQVVETVPGWTHDITNVGEEEMVVMLWASEIFDRSRPDTNTSRV